MSISDVRGVALYKRTNWRKDLDDAKVEMGLMKPFSQDILDYSLYAAVIENNHKAVREMVMTGANPNLWLEGVGGKVAGTLLHFAVADSSLKAVIALLQLGADPFAKDALDRTPREVIKFKQAENRMKSVLKLWEQRHSRPAMNAEALAFNELLKATGTEG